MVMELIYAGISDLHSDEKQCFYHIGMALRCGLVDVPYIKGYENAHGSHVVLLEDFYFEISCIFIFLNTRQFNTCQQ